MFLKSPSVQNRISQNHFHGVCERLHQGQIRRTLSDRGSDWLESSVVKLFFSNNRKSNVKYEWSECENLTVHNDIHLKRSPFPQPLVQKMKVKNKKARRRSDLQKGAVSRSCSFLNVVQEQNLISTSLVRLHHFVESPSERKDGNITAEVNKLKILPLMGLVRGPSAIQSHLSEHSSESSKTRRGIFSF